MKGAEDFRKLFRRSRSGGFSITEVIVALAVAVLAMVGIYSVYISQQKSSESQQLYTNLQNDLRFAMDYMKNELILAGFKAIDSNDPISIAGNNTITFEYLDENLDFEARLGAGYSADYRSNIQVTYSVSGTDLIRTSAVYKKDGALDDFDPSTIRNQVLAEDVTGLDFDYFSSNNVTWSAADTEDIRTIRITLAGRSHKADPTLVATGGGDYFRTLTLTGEVNPRNVAIASNPFDEVPPGVPQNLHSTDPNRCGQLDLSWDGNGEGDLAGYVIYYGSSTGSYTKRQRINREANADNTETYSLTGLLDIETPYYIAIQAVDRSGNVSGLSAEVSGNGSPDDTTINPDPPVPPGDFDASVPTGQENEVQLTWTPVDASVTSGITKYKLFRNDDHTASFDPANPTAGGWEFVNDYPPESTGVTDSGLVGCLTYAYQITALHCDETMFTDGEYTSAEYNGVSGDGPGALSDTPTADISNTTPLDNTPISGDRPAMEAVGGWRRIRLDLDNPLKSEAPDFSHTLVYFSKASPGPQVDADGNVTGGDAIPNTQVTGVDGRYDSYGAILPSINFSSELNFLDVNIIGELDEAETTYYFLAVSYDLCGNSTSQADSAVTLALQCSDCFADQDCHGSPGYPADPVSGYPDPPSLVTEGCDAAFDASWNQIPILTHPDFTGFHIWRREGATWDGSTAPIEWLTDPLPRWSPSIPPEDLPEGVVYSYRIRPVDCFFQNICILGEGDPECAAYAEYYRYIEDVYVGSVIQDDYEPVLTGLLRDYDPLTTPFDFDPGVESSDFYHNTVTFSVENTAAGTLTLKSMDLEWTNANAFLQQVEVGDSSGAGSLEVAWTQSPPAGSGDPPSASLTFSGMTSNETLAALDRDIPIRLTFAGSGGSVSRENNMREETFTEARVYCRNDGTGSVDCEYDLPRFGSTIEVPLGPAIVGAVQDAPENPTISWPVPGDDGVNVMDRVIVPGAVGVNVRANVRDPSFFGLDTVALFYYVDIGAVLSSSPDVSDFDPLSVIAMSRVGTSSVFETDTPIPASDGSNVWYYIAAVDNLGNYDREPEIESGTFQYYQQLADVCNNTPNPPLLTGGVSGSTVELNWTPPTINSDNSTFTDPGGYRIYRNDGAGWTFLAAAAAGDTSSSDSPPDIVDSNYSYYVTTIDTCSPEPNESAQSSTFTECEGAPNCIFNVTASAEPLNPGDTLSVELTVCAKQNTVPNEVVYMQSCSATAGDADPIEMVETGDTGYFTIVPDSQSRDFITLWLYSEYPAHLTPTPGTVTPLDLYVDDSGDDTVLLTAWEDTIYSDSSCASVASCEQQSFTVVAEEGDPCAVVETPGFPQNLNVDKDGSNCSANPKSTRVTLTWDPPSDDSTTDFYRVYSCEGSNCPPTELIGAVDEGTTFPEGGFFHDVGARLDKGLYRFHVRAVNTNGGLCTAEAVEGPASNIDVDPCP